MQDQKIRQIIELVAKVKLNEADKKDIKRQLLDTFDDINIGINDDRFEDSIKQVVKALNTVLGSAGKSINLDDIMQADSGAWKKLGEIAANDFLDAYEEVLKKHSGSGGIELFDEASTKNVLEALQKIVNIMESQSKGGLLKSVVEIDEALGRLKKKADFNEITKALEFEAKDGKDIQKYYDGYMSAIANDDGWEKQYAWLIKFINTYESFVEKKHAQPDEKFSELYSKHADKSVSMRNNLQNLLNRKAGNDLIVSTNLESGALAQESTLKEIKGLLERLQMTPEQRIDADLTEIVDGLVKGLSKNSAYTNPKAKQEEKLAHITAELKKSIEFTSDVSAKIPKLIKDLEGGASSVTVDKIVSELKNEHIKSINGVLYADLKSQGAQQLSLDAKTAGALAEALQRVQGATTDASVSIDENALKSLLQSIVFKVSNVTESYRKDSLNALVDQLRSDKSKKEVGAFFNSTTGEVQQVKSGDEHQIELELKHFIDAANTLFDTRIHKHNYEIAAPSIRNVDSEGKSIGNDFDTWIESFDYIKKHVIATSKELLAFDFTSLTKEKLIEIRDAYRNAALPIFDEFDSYDASKITELGGNNAVKELLQSRLRELLDDIMYDIPNVMKSYTTPADMFRSTDHDIAKSNTTWWDGESVTLHELGNKIETELGKLRIYAEYAADGASHLDSLITKINEALIAFKAHLLEVNPKEKIKVEQNDDEIHDNRNMSEIVGDLRDHLGSLDKILDRNNTLLADHFGDIHRTLKEIIVKFSDIKIPTSDSSSHTFEQYGDEHSIPELIQKIETDLKAFSSSVEHIYDNAYQLELASDRLCRSIDAVDEYFQPLKNHLLKINPNEQMILGQDEDSDTSTTAEDITDYRSVVSGLAGITDQLNDTLRDVVSESSVFEYLIKKINGLLTDFKDNLSNMTLDKRITTEEITAHDKNIESIKKETAARQESITQREDLALPSDDDIKSGNASWRGMPIKYDVKQGNEASNWTTFMKVGPKFFDLDDETKKYTLDHEVAHTVADRIMNAIAKNYAADSKIFISEKDGPSGKYIEGLYGDMNATALSETVTRAVSEYFDSPKTLQQRSTSAYDYIEKYIASTGDTLDNIAAIAQKVNTTAVIPATGMVPAGDANDNQEIQDMTKLLGVVDKVTEAVKLKTRAFATERSTVNQVVDDEITDLERLERKLQSIATTMQQLVGGIQSGESKLSDNLVVNITASASTQDGGLLSTIQKDVSAINDKLTAGKVIVGAANDKPQPKTVTSKSADNQKKDIQDLINLNKKLGSLESQKQFAEDATEIEQRIQAVNEEIQAKQRLVSIDDKLQSQLRDSFYQGVGEVEASRAKEIEKQYEKLGTLYAQFEHTPDGDYKKRLEAELNTLNELIDKEEERINITEEMARNYAKISEDAYAAQLKKLDDASTRQNDKKQIKDTYSKLTEDQIKLGALQAQLEAAKFTENQDTLAQLEAEKKQLDENIRLETQQLNLNKQQTEELAKRNTDAYNKEFKRQIKISQQGAKVTKAGSAVDAADAVIYQAKNVDGLNDADIKQLEEYNEQVRKLQRLQNAARNSKDIITPAQQKELIDQTNNVKQLTKEFKKLLAEHERLSGDNAFDLGEVIGGDVKKQLTDAVMAYTNGKAAIQGYDAATGELTWTIKNNDNTMTEYTGTIDQLSHRMVGLEGSTRRLETPLEKLKRKMGEILTYFGGSSVIYDAINEVRRGIQYVREIDSAMTELRKVTDETEESYERFLDTASKTAEKVGSTISNIANSTADWARLGFSMEEAANLAQSTSVLLNVSEFSSIDEATSALTSTMQAFGYTADQSMDVVDVMNEVNYTCLLMQRCI